jgi:hypothetical protein
MEIIQVIIIMFALFALSRAVLRFKDNKLTKNEFIFWVILWIVVIIISVIPSITSPISNVFGIGRGIDLIIYISVIVLFYLIFHLYVKIDSMEKEITMVVRKLALNPKNRKKK